ncbi:hypothetical protein N9942_02620, partial [Akkermansiaceae bacterium]|nr:hypothetical protein [Akkermansiaceae bacterium]
EGGQTVLVVVNLHPTETFEEITVVIPDDARKWAKLPEKIRLESLLGNSIGEADSNQVRFNSLPALTIQFVELIE